MNETNELALCFITSDSNMALQPTLAIAFLSAMANWMIMDFGNILSEQKVLNI